MFSSRNIIYCLYRPQDPAHDLQAQDRAFRFGQRRDVSVYRFLGAGSLEELIYKRQIYKQQMMKIGYEASHQTRFLSLSWFSFCTFSDRLVDILRVFKVIEIRKVISGEWKIFSVWMNQERIQRRLYVPFAI